MLLLRAAAERLRAARRRPAHRPRLRRDRGDRHLERPERLRPVRADFRDERYLPFEFAGAVSRWRIELPPETNFFDFDTLSDVVLHLNYTAREGGDVLRAAAAAETPAAGCPATGCGSSTCGATCPTPGTSSSTARTTSDTRLEPAARRCGSASSMFPFVPGAAGRAGSTRCRSSSRRPCADPSTNYVVRFCAGEHRHDHDEAVRLRPDRRPLHRERASTPGCSGATSTCAGERLGPLATTGPAGSARSSSPTSWARSASVHLVARYCAEPWPRCGEPQRDASAGPCDGCCGARRNDRCDRAVHARSRRSAGVAESARRAPTRQPACQQRRRADDLAAQGRRRDPRHRREVRRQPGDRHRLDDGPDRDEPGPRRASARSSRSPTTPAPATARSASGWSLALPAITRKTDKGLPRYRDADESDVFILSGAEDLVPVLDVATARAFEDDDDRARLHRSTATGRASKGCSRASSAGRDGRDGDVHWRSITRDNVTDALRQRRRARGSPIPTDPRRVFSWLICETRDDKGNAIVYEYERGGRRGVDPAPCRANRGDRDAQRATLPQADPLRQPPTRDASDLAGLTDELRRWLFEVVFDYGEGHCEELALDPAGHERPAPLRTRRGHAPGDVGGPARSVLVATAPGFEVRTYRRCRRVLMFHHFPDEPTASGYDCLVRSTEFDYADLDYATAADRRRARHQGSTRFASFMRRHAVGLRRDGAAARRRSHLPAAVAAAARVRVQQGRRPGRRSATLDAESLENLPDRARRHDATSGSTCDGEGISGILTEQAGAWFYKRNLGRWTGFGPARDGRRREPIARRARAAARRSSSTSPATASSTSSRSTGRRRASTSATDDEGWEPFRPFAQLPNRRLGTIRTCGSSTSTATATPTC